MAFEKINHKIIGNTNIISETANADWNLELGLVSWFNKNPKIDLHHWSSDHLNMDKGIRLTKDEAIKVRDVLIKMNLEELSF